MQKDGLYWCFSKMICVYTDESWFPDHTWQTVGAVRWSSEACAALRASIVKILDEFALPSLKRSTIRAKKKRYRCALSVLDAVAVRTRESRNQGVMIVSWTSVEVLYTQLFANLPAWDDSWFHFYPDKNLTLQWHTSQHMFQMDKRFLSIEPVRLITEPLIIVADMLAWMAREATERPALFAKKNLSDIPYLPDAHKVALRQYRQYLAPTTKPFI